MAAPRTTQVCVTQAMIDKYGGPSPAPQRGNCQVTNVSIKPNGMTAKITCTGQMTGTGTVEATYTDANTTQSKMHMSGTMQMGQNSHPIDMTVNSTSVYKGADCGSVKPFTMPTSSKPSLGHHFRVSIPSRPARQMRQGNEPTPSHAFLIPVAWSPVLQPSASIARRLRRCRARAACAR